MPVKTSSTSTDPHPHPPTRSYDSINLEREQERAGTMALRITIIREGRENGRRNWYRHQHSFLFDVDSEFGFGTFLDSLWYHSGIPTLI